LDETSDANISATNAYDLAFTDSSGGTFDLTGSFSDGVMDILRWADGIGFDNKYEIQNTIRILLLAVFFGWAYRRFRR